jgi:tetratricopeptide (TPR) repeat protein
MPPVRGYPAGSFRVQLNDGPSGIQQYSGQIMSTRRLFHIVLVLAVSCFLPASPICAHGGGGGGGGHGGGGGGGHAGFSGGGAARVGGGYAGSYSAARFSSAGAHPAYAGSAYHSAAAYHHPGNGNGNWGNHGDWGYNHGYWGGGWGGWGWGLGFPFGFGYWGGYPYSWGGYWGDYYNPYGPVYSDLYPAGAYGYTYPDAGDYAANLPAVPNQTLPNQTGPGPNPPVMADNPQQAPSLDDAAGNEGEQYYNEARAAFAQGDYRNALRLAGHASVESPQNAKVHELTSLALFASGEYRGAATAAHAALALGAPSDWANLYSYYNDNQKYTEQLRKLEKAVTDAPKAAAGQFLLGYHYLMTGAKP